MGVWGKGYDQLKRKPFIYTPSLNRQAPQGTSKNQRSRLFSVPAGPSKNLNGMGVWGKGHDQLKRKPFIYNPSLNRQRPAGYHGGLGEGA